MIKKIAAWVWDILSSRKNRAAVITLFIAIAGKAGWNISDEFAATIVAMGAVLIHSIAKEDAALKGHISPEEWEAFLDARKAKAAGTTPPAKDA